MAPIIEADGLTKHFGDVRALDGLDLVADSGQVTANALRSLTLGGTDAVGIGHSTTYWVVLSLAWCAGIFIVFSTIAVSRFSRRR
jgi:ABC-type uncharacterized transport system ATPase subunit